jgi:ERCC4-type nuclease
MAIPGESPEEIKVGNQAATEKSASGRLKHQSSAIPNLPKEAPKKSRGHPSMAGEPSSPDGSAKRLRENKNNDHPGVAILCTIPGVNQARAMAILEHFGSVRAFDQAILKERMQVPGIGRTLAKRFDQVMELPYRKGAKHEDV